MPQVELQGYACLHFSSTVLVINARVLFGFDSFEINKAQ